VYVMSDNISVYDNDTNKISVLKHIMYYLTDEMKLLFTMHIYCLYLTIAVQSGAKIIKAILTKKIFYKRELQN